MSGTDIELARALFPKAKDVVAAGLGSSVTVRTERGRAVSDSSEGLVEVVLDTVVAGGDATIECPTSCSISEGDEVLVYISGTTPVDVVVAGEGDRQDERIHAIEADYVKATTLEADVADIGFLKADSATIKDLKADTAKVHDLTADQLSAAAAYIASLNAKSVTAETLAADVAKVHDLTADGLSAAAAYIAQLSADSVTAQRIAAISGDFDTVRANAAKVANLTAVELEADHATIGSLDANYAKITNGHIDSALIDTAAIVDEQVFTVTGNKATLAQIDASKINVLNLKAKDIEVERINGQPVTNKTLVDALSQHESDISDLDTKIDNEVEALNDRIDGAIETFTGTVVPTLNNTPASSWNTTKLKDQHVGDVYYVVNSQSAQNGYCYRFTKSGSTYSWQLIKDSDVTAALSRLQTAEGKIGDIEQFDETVGSFMTNTDDELSSLKAKDTQLETSLGDKVSTSTFNTVSQKVDTNEANITSMSTVLTNNGLTSSTNITNTVNTVKQTADTNTSNISSLQTTVSGHTTTIQQHTTSIGQNTDAIALRATKTEVQQVRPAYATSTTGAGTAAKVATIDPAVTSYALYKGASVAVTFSTANTAATPTLNLNSTGAKQIRSYTGAALSEAEYKWAAGATVDLVYDGTYWRMQDGGSVKRVTAAEASIKVNADSIESKVSKDGVISSINQSAETVKIQASRVEIDGTAVFSAISSDVDDAITGKGYQTSSQVESAITSKGYQTSSQVNSAITSKGYQTSSQVESAITSKGYATTTQAQGYASTAKSEAISAAATDATTKANAAEANAKNDTTSRLNAMGADNKVVNGAFVNGTDNWSAWGTPTTRNRVQVNGKWWMHCVTTATKYQGYQQNNYTSLGVTVEPSTTYTVGITARGAAANTTVCVGFHWYAPSGTSIVSQSWLTFTVGTTAARQYQTVTVPSGIDHFNVMVGQGVATAQEFWITDVTLVKGTVNQEWSESSALAGQASITANAAAPKGNAVKRTQRIWYRKSASGAPSTPGTASSNWVTKADDGNDAWTKMHIAISSTHKYIYTCEQYEMANGTVGYTSVLLDNTITVIDGGNLITGSVTANKLNAADINASKTLTVGAMTDAAASTILNSNVVAGGDNLIGNFNYTLVHNATYDYSTGTLTSLTTTNTANNSVYIQALTGTTSTSAGTFVREIANIGNSSNVGQIIHGTFEKTADFTHIKLKFNGNKSDADVFWDISSIPTGTQLTLSCKLDSISSDGKGNGGVLSGINLRAGNAASQWSLAPRDETIGGRNLLLWTANLPKGSDNTVNGKDGIAAWGDTLGQLIETDEGIRLNAAGNSNECIGIPLANNGSVGNNEDVLLTFEARGNITSIGQFFWLQASGANVGFTKWLNGNQTISLSETSWTKFTTNVKHAQANIRTCTRILIFYGLGSSNNGKWVEIRKSTLKLEKGIKSTDWTPAPEDQTEYTDSIAYQTSKPNLVPWFSAGVPELPSTYWTHVTGPASTQLTDLGDGWCRIVIDNTTGTSTARYDYCPVAAEGIGLGKDYTMLFEFRNISNSTKSANVYTVQQGTYGMQFWGNYAKKVLQGYGVNCVVGLTDTISGTGNRAELCDDGIYRKRIVRTSEASDSTYWTRSDDKNCVTLVAFAPAGAMFDAEMRFSIYEGEYTGPYKPYSGTQLYASGTDVNELNASLIATEESLSGQIRDTNDSLGAVSAAVTKLDETVQNDRENMGRWLNFNESEGLTIGKAGSAFKVVTDETRQAFMYGNETLAYTSGDRFVAPRMEADELHIGNWMWVKRDNGNLSLKWIG